MLSFFSKTLEKEIVFKINPTNRSIVFNENYVPPINSHYTENRFFLSVNDINLLNRQLSKTYLLAQEKSIPKYIGSQELTKDEEETLLREYLKTAKRESKRIMKYVRFYYGFVAKNGDRKILIQAIDFNSVNQEILYDIKNKNITKILFTNDWNQYNGMVYETLIYDLQRQQISSLIPLPMRILRFANEECEAQK